MPKPKTFHVPGALLIEQRFAKDGPSPYFVAWKPHSSRLFHDRSEMMRWVKWPKGTPTREAIEEFLDACQNQANGLPFMQAREGTAANPNENHSLPNPRP